MNKQPREPKTAGIGIEYLENLRFRGILNGLVVFGSINLNLTTERFAIKYADNAPKAYSSPRKNKSPKKTKIIATIEKIIVGIQGVQNLG
jgi:hypothetical protein